MSEPIAVELRHITKSFPGIKANDDISLTLRQGEIHALLGENGAGKSTLMSILFGLYTPDEGEIFVKGQKVNIKNPNEATALGIGMVHQHFKLVGCYTALQNIILGYEPTTKLFGFLKPKQVRKSLEELCEKYHFDIDLDKKIDDMAVGEQQKVEILKMLYRQNNILIFDEPTAVLTPQEIDSLMLSFKELVKQGKSILFISHKLNEILAVADRVTILRKGRVIPIIRNEIAYDAIDVKDTNAQELSKLMVGRDVQLTTVKNPCHIGEDILTVNNLVVFDNERKKNVVNNLSLKVKKGEIVCIAGIEGNGQSQLIYALTGIDKIKSGEAILHNVDRNRYLKIGKSGQEDTVSKIWRYFKGSVSSFFFNYIKEPIKYFCINFIANPLKPFFQMVGRHLKIWFSIVFAYIKYFFKNIGNFFKKLFKKEASENKVPDIRDEKYQYVKPELPEQYKMKHLKSPKEIDGQPRFVDVHLEDMTVRQRSLSGLSHIPEDRQKYGLALDFSLKDNLVLQRYFESQFQTFGFINEKAKARYAEQLIKQYDIRSSLGVNTIVRSMSGGNQQKAIIARELDRNCPLLIAVQPTRGLDVGAIENIHREILKQRDAGSGVLLISLELEEVMNLSDRILVMFNGQIVAELNPKETNVNEIGMYMSGSKRMTEEDMRQFEENYFQQLGKEKDHD